MRESAGQKLGIREPSSHRYPIALEKRGQWSGLQGSLQATRLADTRLLAATYGADFVWRLRGTWGPGPGDADAKPYAGCKVSREGQGPSPTMSCSPSMLTRISMPAARFGAG